MTISSTLIDRAEIRFHPAAPMLQAYVGCFWIIKAEHGATVRSVPDGTTSICIEQGLDGSTDGYLRGPQLRPLELRFSAATTLIGIRLRPGVAFCLTGTPAHTMVDRRIPMAHCTSLGDIVACATSPRTADEWINLLQAFLLDRLAGDAVPPVIATAIDEIHQTQGCISIADVAARCAVSERHLGRLMRNWIGYGPKRYAGIVRFQSALTQMERAPELPAAALATETGYFDQAHLSFDVGRYAGETPGHLKSTHAADFSKTRCDVPF